MPASLGYDPSAVWEIIDRVTFAVLEPRLGAARDEVFKDVQLLESGGTIPAEKDPLDAGFIEFPARLLAEHHKDPAGSLIGRIQACAREIQEELDRVVVLGIGGSYMGARALFEALCHRYHNELDREQRRGIPRIYFEGNNVDNDTLRGLLELLKMQCFYKADARHRWGIVVISKSGGTLETAVAFRLFRDALEHYYGADSDESRQFVIPVTGETGKLRNVSNAAGYPVAFPIPDGIGGRFSIFTAVGLLPAAILGIDIVELLQGAADMTRTFRTAPLGANPVMDYTAVCHLAERDHGMSTRILSTWGSRLEAAGLWYDQLLAESLGKSEKGAFPLTVVNTRDLHSRGQQHQEGVRDKLITNLIVDKASTPPLEIPKVAAERDLDQLNKFAGKKLPEVLSAAIAGTNQAYADDNRPTANIHLPEFNAYSLGQFLQMMMLATVLEGRLIGINPYGQPGVEAYKRNMTAILSK